MTRKTLTAAALTAALLSGSAFAAISAQDAISKAEAQTGGQAVGLHQLSRGNDKLIAVETMGDNGPARVLLNADTGAVIPAFEKPAFSLSQAIDKAQAGGATVKDIRLIAPRPFDGKKGKDDKNAQTAKKPQAFYLATVEKDGKTERLAFSAQDGSAIDSAKLKDFGRKDGKFDGKDRKGHDHDRGDRQAPPQDGNAPAGN